MDELTIWARKARQKSGLTQEQLGEKMDVTKANVSSWENGRHHLGFEQMRKLSEISGLPMPGYELSAASIGTRRVPVIDYVQAGNWTGVSEGMSESDVLECILTDQELSPGAFAMRIRGDSMQPAFGEGDMVIVDPEVAPQPGDFVVAANGGGEAVFKQYRVRGYADSGVEIFELVPLNELYPTLRSDVQHIRVVGTMMEHRRFRRR